MKTIVDFCFWLPLALVFYIFESWSARRHARKHPERGT